MSRARGATEAYEIAVDGGRKATLKPAALGGGTRIEVRDLFYATPARLKFMKSERAETAAIADIVKRLALAKPEIAFSLTIGDRTTLRLDALPAGLLDHGLPRLGRILGEDFVTDALAGARRARIDCRRGLRRACRRCTARTAFGNISWSMAGRCATSCSPAPCAAATATSCRTGGIPCLRSSSRCLPTRST